MHATLNDPRITGATITEIIAYHTDDDGTRSASAILHTGDVLDLDLQDVTITAA